MLPPELPGLPCNAMRLLWALVEQWDGEPIRAESLVSDVTPRTVRRSYRILEFWQFVKVHHCGAGWSHVALLEPTFIGRRLIERAMAQPLSAAEE